MHFYPLLFGNVKKKQYLCTRFRSHAYIHTHAREPQKKCQQFFNLKIKHIIILILGLLTAATARSASLALDSTLIVADTVSVGPDSVQLVKDSVHLAKDSVAPDSVAAPKKQAIDAKIEYTSTDSMVIMGNGVAYMYGSGDVKYKNMGLTAEFIRVHMDSSLVYAKGVLDTVENEWVGKPVFIDGDQSYETDEMTYNLSTKKGYIVNAITEQGEGYVVAGKSKKTEDDLLMMAAGRYTTCDQHDHPHFYLHMTKAKVKPGDYIATGPAYLVVGDVPLPLAIPFGFFPFTDSYSSGLIMPNFGDDYTRGLYLSGIGYYFAINDYMDLQLTGDIYTRGTWAVYAQSRYLKRYKFNGNFSINYRWDVTGEKDMPDYMVAKNLSVQWSHRQDAKANPYNNFSASVNFKTSGYNRSNINSYYDVAANSENTTSSSISYTQRFPDSPWNIGLSMNLTQRTKDSTLNVTLPSLTVSMSRIYPFKKKQRTGKEKWYEKISLNYNGSFNNSITCKEDYFFKSNFVKDWNNKLNHKLGSSATFMAFKYLSITPSIDFTDRMFFSRVDQSWNEKENRVNKDTVMGFYNVYDFNMGVGLSTKLYGFYTPFRKWFGDKVDKFRHVMTPSLNFSYSPDFGEDYWAKRYGGFYGSYNKLVAERDEAGNWVPKLDENGLPIYETVHYSRFKEAPGRGASATLGFGLANNIEMKLRNDKDTTGKEPYKVYSIIDNLSINGGYNFIADSMNWSVFSMNVRIKIPKVNYTITLDGKLDPYMYTTTPSGAHVRCNELYWNHGRAPHFLGTSTSIAYTLSNDVVKKWFSKEDDKKKGEEGVDGEENLEGEEGIENEVENEEADKKGEVTEDGYLFAEIPWSVNLRYTLRYTEGREWDEVKNYYKMEFRHSFEASMSIGLGKGWKASSSLSYDFNAKKLAYTSINVSRDLHCWSMSGTFVPFGPYKSYTFHIGVKAGMLADLKYDKTSSQATGKTVDWW